MNITEKVKRKLRVLRARLDDSHADPDENEIDYYET